jgi:beta-galactosidase
MLPGVAADGPRVVEDLSPGWKFLLTDDAGIESPDYSGAERWPTVELPHTWNTKDILDDVPGYNRGVGWYRKVFTVPAACAGKRLVIHFDAAYQVATVWVNGNLVGEHRGGFTPFEFDITNIAIPGKRNIVAVRVDSRWRRDLPPYDMDYNMMGGLYRPACLIASDKVYIDSTSVTTPVVSRQEAVAAFDVTIRNQAETDASLELITEILDPDGKQVQRLHSAVTANAGRTLRVRQQTDRLENPRLWSPDGPNLYRVVFRLQSAGVVTDQEESPLGFRWYRFDPQQGFFLNGSHLKLRGANRMDDYPGLGWALPASRQVKDIQLVKEIGANFLRLAHYPQHPAVLETCDRIGLLVWQEIPFDGEGEQLAPYAGARGFAENAKQMLREMIRRDRNHPAVILWSVGNENLNGSSREEWEAVSQLERELADLARSEDPARPTALAMDQFDRADLVGLYDAVDVVGLNIYRGWYGGEIEDVGGILDEVHRKHPSKPLIVSEYGAGMELGRHSENPRRFDFSEEWGRSLHEWYLKQIDARPFVAGSAIWSIFDFGAEKRTTQTIPHMNQKGIYDYYRRPKDVYYFYQSQWTQAPMVYIVSHTWTERQGKPGEAKTIRVYSNCDRVGFFLNEKALGEKRAGEPLEWEVVFRPGENELRAVGYKDGQSVIDSMKVTF